ncbi:MAG: PspC domain-containing protein [Lentimicrobiaceae bacterium]|nr:PspC domain-containing protein [Lentimicrobiaceae bacterium]
MQKKLTRSTTDRKVAGVCGGLGEYLDVDPLIFRIIFLFLLLCGGSGLLLYLIMWILMPEKKKNEPEEIRYEPEEIYDVTEEPVNHSPHHKKSMKKHHNKGVFWGLLFVAIGVLWLGKSFGLFYFSWHSVFKLWPLFIVWLGVIMLPIGHAWKIVCNFILLAIAIALLFMLPLRSWHHRHFWDEDYVIKKKISTSDCRIEIDEDDLDLDIDVETIMVTAHGDSIVIDQKSGNKEEKVVIKKVKK